MRAWTRARAQVAHPSILLVGNLERFKTLAGSIALFPFIGTCDASGENTLRYTDWSVWREHVELSTGESSIGAARARTLSTERMQLRRGGASNGLRNGPRIRSHDSSYHFCSILRTFPPGETHLGLLFSFETWDKLFPSVRYPRLSTKFKRYTVAIEFLRIEIRRKEFHSFCSFFPFFLFFRFFLSFFFFFFGSSV